MGQYHSKKIEFDLLEQDCKIRMIERQLKYFEEKLDTYREPKQVIKPKQFRIGFYTVKDLRQFVDHINQRQESIISKTRLLYSNIFGTVPDDLDDPEDKKYLNDAFILIQSEKRDYLNQSSDILLEEIHLEEQLKIINFNTSAVYSDYDTTLMIDRTPKQIKSGVNQTSITFIKLRDLIMMRQRSQSRKSIRQKRV